MRIDFFSENLYIFSTFFKCLSFLLKSIDFSLRMWYTYFVIYRYCVIERGEHI